MKNFVKTIIAALFFFSILFVSCKKDSDSQSSNGGGESSDVRVTTYSPQDITPTSAKCGGDAIVTQGLSLTEIGVCWNITGSPSADDAHLGTDVWNEPFVCTLTDLEPNTIHYVRAYALRGLEYYYGDTKTFTTLSSSSPMVRTLPNYSISGDTIWCIGLIDYDGGSPIIAKGFCWSTHHNPTLIDNYINVGSGIEGFSTAITNLEANTTYYIRAYATNSYETGYGEEITVIIQHTQVITLGSSMCNIDHVTTIENIQHNGGQLYSSIVFSNGEMNGNQYETAKGVVILFYGDIISGTFNLSSNNNYYPKYFYVNDIDAEDIINFDINILIEENEAYIANSGSFTISIDDNHYTIETADVEVSKVDDPGIVTTSSVDYDGAPSRFILSTVEEGFINDASIATAGSTQFITMFIEHKTLCFITEAGDMIGMIYQGNSIPTGTFETATLLYAHNMDVNSGTLITQGSITIEKNGDIYTVNMPEINIGTQDYVLHYIGTLPYFEYPF